MYTLSGIINNVFLRSGTTFYYNLGNVGISNTATAYNIDVNSTGNFSGNLTVGNLTPNCTYTAGTVTQTSTSNGAPSTNANGNYCGLFLLIIMLSQEFYHILLVL